MVVPGIDTVIFCMLENRSFDHMLGYLSLDETPDPIAVDGLRTDPAWRSAHTNSGNGQPHQVNLLKTPAPIEDPPHGLAFVKQQINTAPAGPGPTKMGGFVQSFIDSRPVNEPPKQPWAVMGYYDAGTMTSYDFLARNYCVCDRWFTPLPLGTQANRLMAMAGHSLLTNNSDGLIPYHKLVYEWLKEKEVDWRVYVSGGFAPFFLLMEEWILPIGKSLAFGTGRFRRFGQLRKHWKSDKVLPKVIFVEPEYRDAPRDTPNDDHPPTPVDRGQAFIRELYNILISNEARWAKTLLIITYDEHGGFFDHVPPPAMDVVIGKERFTTTGPRVPALLVSPLVNERQVFSQRLDHTSFLQFLDDCFGSGNGYSEAVTTRHHALNLSRIKNALRTSPRPGKPKPIPAPVETKGQAAQEAVDIGVAGDSNAPKTPNAAALHKAARKLADEHPDLIRKPGWKKMKDYLDHNPQPRPVHRSHIGEATLG